MRPLRLLLLLPVAVTFACSGEQLEAVEQSLSAPQVQQEEEAFGPLRERAHQVSVRVEGRVAVFTVLRELELVAPEPSLDTRTLTVPQEGSVSALRFAPFGQWLKGEPLEGEAASTRFYGEGEARATPRAMLGHLSASAAELVLFLTEPNRPVWVGYELRAPLSLVEGEWVARYPPLEPGDAAPTFDLSGAPAGSRSTEEVSSESDEDVDGWRIHLGRPELQGLEARWGRFELGGGEALWRLELAAGSTLRPEPASVSVVFAVDASRSQGPEGLARQLSLIRSYLANAPAPEVEVVVYRRAATRLFGRFVPAADFERALAQLPSERLALGNGSHLDEGAALAAEVARGGRGEPRVVLFTDDRLRAALSLEATAARLGLPGGGVVHVALVDGQGGGGAAPERAPGHRLEALARASGGEVLEHSGVQIGLLTAQELVRPLRVDALSYEVAGFEGDTLDGPTALVRGSSESRMALAKRPPSEVTVRGFIWGRPLELRVPRDAAFSESLPLFAVHQGSALDLSEEQIALLARHTGAVSEGQALVAVPPGDSGALGVGRGISGGFGCSGTCGSSIGCRGYGSATARPTLRELLEPLVAPVLARCGAAPARVRVEVTGAELVDVAVESQAGAECASEGIWALALSETFERYDGEALLELR